LKTKIKKQAFPAAAPKSMFRHLDRIPAMLSFWTDDRLHMWVSQQKTQRAQEAESAPIPTVDNIHELLKVLDFGE
jgi:hypothetical protein